MICSLITKAGAAKPAQTTTRKRTRVERAEDQAGDQDAADYRRGEEVGQIAPDRGAMTSENCNVRHWRRRGPKPR